MTRPIRGKVASVINKREIAINLGTAHGVDVGMDFDIMETIEVDIKDPDTGEVLGSLEHPKIRVKVTHVQEKLSVATIHQASGVNFNTLGTIGTAGALTALTIPTLGPIAMALIAPAWLEKRKRSEKREITDSVNAGDTVVQVIEKTE